MSRRSRTSRVPFYLGGALMAATYLVARFGDGPDMLVRVSAALFLLWSVALVIMTVRGKKENK